MKYAKKTLRQRYESLCGEYIEKFVKKHQYEFSGWVADDIGGIAVFIEQYFFNFEHIRYDIDNDAPVEMIFHWQDDSLLIEKPLNFKTYLKLNQ